MHWRILSICCRGFRPEATISTSLWTGATLGSSYTSYAQRLEHVCVHDGVFIPWPWGRSNVHDPEHPARNDSSTGFENLPTGARKSTSRNGSSAIEVDGARVVEGSLIPCWVCKQLLYLATGAIGDRYRLGHATQDATARARRRSRVGQLCRLMPCKHEARRFQSRRCIRACPIHRGLRGTEVAVAGLKQLCFIDEDTASSG